MPIHRGRPQFLVPDWLLGTAVSVVRAVQATSESWLAARRSSRAFPDPRLIPCDDAEVILWSTSDHEQRRVAVRLFAMVNFFGNVSSGLSAAERPALIAEYESHVGRYPWGAFDNLMRSVVPNDLATTKKRLENVLSQFEAFASVRMIDVGNEKRTGVDVLDRYHGETLSNWIGSHASSLQDRIEMTLQTMATATPAWIRERLASLLVGLAATMGRIKNREKMTPEYVAAHIASLTASEYEGLTGLTSASLRQQIYGMDRGRDS